MPLDRNTGLGCGRNKPRAPLTHDGIGTKLHRFVPEANRFDLARRSHQWNGKCHERVGCRAANCGCGLRIGRIETNLHRVDAGLLRGNCLLDGER